MVLPLSWACKFARRSGRRRPRKKVEAARPTLKLSWRRSVQKELGDGEECEVAVGPVELHGGFRAGSDKTPGAPGERHNRFGRASVTVKTVDALERAGKRSLWRLHRAFRVEEIVRSIIERTTDESVSGHVGGSSCVRHACAEEYRYRSKTELPPAFRREMHYAQRFVFRLKDVFVSIRKGASYLEGNAFLESYGSLRKWLLDPPARKIYSKRVELEGPVTCVHTTGFAHYLLEEVPRIIWAARAVPTLTLLLPAQRPHYVDMICAALIESGTLRNPPMVLGCDTAYCKDLILTQAEAYSGFWHRRDLEVLRETFRRDRPDEKGDLKVYISRRHASRGLGNEAAMESFLSQKGFITVTPERLTFSEQEETFSRARVIVGNHGAGFANLVWCEPGTRVIELFGPVFNDCFARLATARGCSYEPIWGRREGADGYIVDPEEVEKALEGG